MMHYCKVIAITLLKTLNDRSRMVIEVAVSQLLLALLSNDFLNNDRVEFTTSTKISTFQEYFLMCGFIYKINMYKYFIKSELEGIEEETKGKT